MRTEYVEKKTTYHSLSIDEALRELETDQEAGLSEIEAQERLAEFGPNALPKPEGEHFLVKFFKHFNNILVYVLLFSALITLVLGHYVDSTVIILVAVLNAIIGFVQENKAEKALEDIKELLPTKTHVTRDGKRLEIELADLTMGDLVWLNPGDKVPADLRLVRADNLRIEESALTGEAVPEEKNTEPVPTDTPLADRHNMAYSGTTVMTGSGEGVVTAVGSETEIGHINQLMAEVKTLTTPLLRHTNRFGQVVSFTVIAISVAVYLFAHFFQNYEPSELLLAVIGLAVGAIPEGLPAILSIILALGVRNMARRKAIIRNLPSVETLGSVTTICSDKTGTLTQNQMTVKAVVTATTGYEVSGSGYAPQGEITADGQVVELGSHEALNKMLYCFALCNEAELTQNKEGRWTVKGDPTEGALLALVAKSPIEYKGLKQLDMIPFDSDYQYMAVLIQNAENSIIYIKGAPDRLLEMADNKASELDRAYWAEEIRKQAALGRRLIGGAYKVIEGQPELTTELLTEGVIFLGLAAMVDPPQPEVPDSIKACHEAGIRVKMITGDHLETAKAIGFELGIGDGKSGVSGRELAEMSDEQLKKAAMRYDIFARTSPEHKLKLVAALQAEGEVVAMTGDGVNDAPALKKAEVGVAMGIKGTEVTKDSAEMVLADDNFSTIVAAVEEGRRVYANLKKTILYILPTNGAEGFLMMAAILFGLTLPLTPVQILWVNMVTAVTLSLALAFEEAEGDIMKRPPRPPKEPLLNSYFIWRIFYVSFLIGGLLLFMSTLMFQSDMEAERVRTITLQSLVFCQAFHLFNSRSILGSAWSSDFFGNKAIFVVLAIMLVVQLAVTYLPVMNKFIGTVPLSPLDWFYPLVTGAIVFFAVEGEKAVMRLRQAKSLANT